MTRFYHAFKWQTVVDVIKKRTQGIVLLACPDYDPDFLKQLSPEEKARTIVTLSIYDDAEVKGIIYAANKPADKTWVDWLDPYNGGGSCPDWFEKLSQCDASLRVSTLVLMEHPNRTNNLHKIIAQTSRLQVISSTDQCVAATGEKQKSIPDVRWLYGRPSFPDFGNLTDEIADLYRRDGVQDIDSLIPVYDFSVQSFSHKQILDENVKERAPLVLLNDQPMLRAESITELFAWRGTGKTMLSLGLGLHMAAGKNMPGLEIPNPCKVLYVEGELPKAQLLHRIKQLSADFTIPDGNFEVIGKSLHGKGQTAVSIKTETGRQAIEAAIERMGAEVLIVDSIASLAQINTNNEEQWLPIIQWMVDLRCKGMCVVYLQQAGKGGEQRGHSVSEDCLDLAIRLTANDTNPDGAAFTMTFTKEREGSLTPLRLKCTKGVWSLDVDKPAKKTQPATTKDEDRETLILEALNAGESQRQIAERFKVSLRDVNAINKLTKEATNNDSINAEVSG